MATFLSILLFLGSKSLLFYFYASTDRVNFIQSIGFGAMAVLFVVRASPTARGCPPLCFVPHCVSGKEGWFVLI